jgi:integrase
VKAERHRESILYSIENNTFDYSITFPDSKKAKYFSEQKEITIKDYLTEWLEDKKPTIKTSTYVDYVKTINILINQFGEINLHDLKRKNVYEWVKNLNCSNKRISNLISPLKTALSDAYQNGIIESNVISGWNYKKIQPPKKSDVDPFSQEEQKLILSELSGQAKNLIQFMFWSGLRTSEVVALEWGDIDFKNKTALIQRAKTQSAKTAETTKTKSGERELKLLAPALDALIQQKQHTFLKRGIVFNNPMTNLPWAGDQPIRRTLWIPALKKAGVKYRRPYQTRHTYASMNLSAGETLAWVSNQMGHSTVIITAKVYATYIKDSQPGAGNKTVELFGGGIMSKTKADIESLILTNRKIK